MGNCLTRLNSVVLLFRRPCISLSGLSSLSSGVLPNAMCFNSDLRVVLRLRANPPRPLTMSLRLKARFLGPLRRFGLVPLENRASKSLTLSMYLCSPCVKVGSTTCGVAAVNVVSATRLDISARMR